jgi:hypothetical protein
VRYYLSYKGKVFGYAMTKEEVERMLRKLNGVLGEIEIMEFDDKVIPISRRKLVNSKARKKPKT